MGCERASSVDLFLWISFSLFSSLQDLTQKSVDPALFCSSTWVSFISFSIYLFFLRLLYLSTAVTSNGQLPSVALWRTKPGFVDMVTERQDRWGWSMREGWERKWQAHTHNHAHTYTLHRLCLFPSVGEGCRGYLGTWWKSQKLSWSSVYLQYLSMCRWTGFTLGRWLLICLHLTLTLLFNINIITYTVSQKVVIKYIYFFSWNDCACDLFLILEWI